MNQEELKDAQLGGLGSDYFSIFFKAILLDKVSISPSGRITVDKIK